MSIMSLTERVKFNLSSHCDLVVHLVILFTSVICCNCFNLDAVNYVQHRGMPNSMFGFSVAEHKYNGTSWVIVGAPEAQSDQPGVVRGGAVYRCSIVADDTCQPLPFDRKGNTNNTYGQQLDQKSNQWFGATVSAAGEDGPVVACAPRYTWFSTVLNRRDPIGTCYVSKPDFSEFNEYSPCRTRAYGYHRQGSCQAGLGAALSRDGSRVFVGAPGSWYWQGQFYSIDPTVKFKFIPPRHKLYGDIGQVFQQNLVHTRPLAVQTPEGPLTDDDSYLGYSVAAGDFTGEGEDGVAVGMPRGAGLFGKVNLYTWNLINHQNITGEQLGAYFGYSLASADVDGDDFDDLIIGAPMYTDLSNNEGKYETGRVYVIYQRSDMGMFRKLDRLDGINSRARFGLSVSTAGDLNLDGYDDIAIGAPYDGKYGQGAVYIYHGSKTGIRPKPSQTIFAEDLNEQYMSTFGFSVSGGIDLDNNEYPDLVVGAYESNTALFIRSRPVVKMESTLSFQTNNKRISIEETNCTLRSRQQVPCTALEACLLFKGTGVGRYLDIDLQFILDGKKSKNPRLFFLQEEGRNLMNVTKRLEFSNQFCQRFFVYIKNGVRDKLTPIEAEMRYSIAEVNSYPNQRRNGRAPLLPVLDQTQGLVKKDSISIQKNCGRDDVCIPDLRLIATPNTNKILLGSKEKLKIDVEVQNEGEDAFETIFYMKVPAGINFVRTERLDHIQKEILVTCSAPQPANNNTLKCDIGNPLPHQKVVHFNILLEPFHEIGMKPSYEFLIEVNSTNAENNLTVSDNKMTLSIDIYVETDFTIEGTSKPQEIYYNSSQYNDVLVTQEAQIGPQMIHIYNLRNKGPSNIDEAEIFFAWPTKTHAGDTLVYMLDEPELAGNIKCEYVDAINEYNLQVDKRRSYLESNGIATGYLVSSYSNRGGIIVEESSRKHSQARQGLTSEEKLKLDEEENTYHNRETEGDASFVHSNRQKQQWEQNQKSGNREINKVTFITPGSESTVNTYNEEHHLTRTDGEPIKTYWVHNETWFTGPDGVTKYYNTSEGNASSVNLGISGGANAGSNIYYTSSGSRNTGITGTVDGNTGSVQASTNRQGHQRGNVFSDSKQVTSSGKTYTEENGQPVHVNQWGRNETWTTDEDGKTRHYLQLYGNEPGARRGNVDITGKSKVSGGVGFDNVNVNYDARHDDRQASNNERIHYGSRQDVGQNGQNRQTNRQESGSSTTTLHQSGLDYNPRNRQNTYHQSLGSGSGSDAGKTIDQYDYDKTHHIGPYDVRVHGVVKNETERKIWTEEQVNPDFLAVPDKELQYYDTRRGGTVGKVSGGKTSYVSSAEAKNEHRIQGGRTFDSSGSRVGTTSGTATGTTSVNAAATETRRTQSNRRDPATYGKHNNREYDPRLGMGNAALGVGSGGAYTGFVDLGVLNGAGHQKTVQNVDVTRTYESTVDSDNDGTLHGQNQGSRTQTQTRTQSGGGIRQNQGTVSQSQGSIQSQGSRKTQGSVQYGTSYTGHSGERNVNSQEYDPDLGYSRSYEEYDYDRTPNSAGSDRSAYARNLQSSGVRQGTSSYSREYEAHTSSRNTNANADTQFQLYKRTKRDLSKSDEEIGRALACKATQCAVMRCVAGPLTKEQPEAWIVFRARANATTVRRVGGGKPVNLSTMMVARISKLPYIGKPIEQPIKSHEVFTSVVQNEIDAKSDGVPFWLVVLAAVIGAIILLLLIYLLYKCGFFKRNRPNDTPERQPLNGNGHFQHGDEQL